METISAKEFQKRYGTQGVAMINESKSKGSGFIDRLKSSAGAGFDKIKKGFQGASDNKGNLNPLRLVQDAGRIAGGATEVLTSPFAAAAEPVVKPTLGAALNYTADKISNNKTVQKFATSNAGRRTSTAVETISDYNNLAGLIAGPKVGKAVVDGAVNTTTRTASQIASNVESTISKTKSALPSRTAISDFATTIPKTTETALQNIKPQMFDNLVKVGQKAMEDITKPTPMNYVGDMASKALNVVQKQLKTAGEWKGKVLEGIGHNRMGTIGAEARTSMWTKMRDTAGITLDEQGNIVNVKGRIPSISNQSDYALLREVDTKLSQIAKNPTMREVDDVIDYLQGKLYDSKTVGQIPINGRVEGILKNTIGELNSKARTIGGDIYAKANQSYSTLLELRNKANLALGKEGNKGAALMKQLFSPAGTAPRKLFSDIKKATGVDLANHAEVAKFIMENLGDTRQANLLEQVLKGQVSPSKSGIVSYLVDQGLAKIQDPIGKAQRLIESFRK